jgi:hypothetical protein
VDTHAIPDVSSATDLLHSNVIAIPDPDLLITDSARSTSDDGRFLLFLGTVLRIAREQVPLGPSRCRWRKRPESPRATVIAIEPVFIAHPLEHCG